MAERVRWWRRLASLLVYAAVFISLAAGLALAAGAAGNTFREWPPSHQLPAPAVIAWVTKAIRDLILGPPWSESGG